MNKVKILHTGDWHFGARQYGSRMRELDYYIAAKRVADIATQEQVDAVLLTGDVFDAVRPPAEAVRRFSEIVRHLKTHGIPVIGIDGNHDASGGDWLAACGATWIDNRVVGVWSKDRTVELRIGGFSFTRPAKLRELLDGEEYRCDILALHQEVSEMCGYQSRELLAEELAPVLAARGVKYVALGHIHDYGESEIGGIRWAYPGSLEITSRNEAPSKYVNIVTWDGNAIDSTVVTLRPRPFARVALADLEGVRAVIRDLDPGTSRCHPVVVGDYMAKDKAIADAAAELLDNVGLTYKFTPIYASASVPGITAAGHDARKSVAEMLRESVDDFFEPGSDCHSLVVQALQTPARARDIMLTYANDNGVIVR